MAELLTVARPYAKAAFEYARDHEALDSWSKALGFLSAAVANSDVRRLLGSPKLENDKKVALLSDMLPEQSTDVSRFLDTLADQGRLLALPFIAEQFEHLRADHALSEARPILVAVAVELRQHDGAVQYPRQQHAVRQTLARRLQMRHVLTAPRVRVGWHPRRQWRQSAAATSPAAP